MENQEPPERKPSFRSPAVLGIGAIVIALIAAMLWSASRHKDLPTVYEFPPGFRGRFVVVFSLAEPLTAEGGAYVVRIPSSGTTHVPSTGYGIGGESARYAGGGELPLHVFYFHHVPPVDVAVWSFGLRQHEDKSGRGPWEAGGFVGSWDDAARDYREWNDNR